MELVPNKGLVRFLSIYTKRGKSTQSSPLNSEQFDPC